MARGRWVNKVLWLPVLVAAIAMSFGFSAKAQAGLITVGNPLTSSFNPLSEPCIPLCTVTALALPQPGAHVASPTDGVVVRWHLLQASGTGFKLRVLRPIGATAYLGVGTSRVETPSSEGLQNFATNLPIQKGDLVGLDFTGIDVTLGWSNTPGVKLGFWHPPLLDGSSSDPFHVSDSGQEAAFNAQVLPPPTLTTITPATGPLEGGVPVAIAGSNFMSVSAISFGGVPARGFQVDSVRQITAITPPRSAPGAVDVSVTTIAGVTPSVDGGRYTYEAVKPVERAGCVVPKLRGKRLRVAFGQLRRARCKVGNVKRRKCKRRGACMKPHKRDNRKVVGQHPRPGRALPLGSRVNVVYSYKRARR